VTRSFWRHHRSAARLADRPGVSCRSDHDRSKSWNSVDRPDPYFFYRFRRALSSRIAHARKDGHGSTLHGNSSRQKEGRRRSSDVSRRTVTISKITMQQGVVELFDATVSRPPLKIRLERVNGVIRDIKVPWLETKTHFELVGVVKGMRRDGSAKAAGWVGLAGKDSSSQITLDAV